MDDRDSLGQLDDTSGELRQLLLGVVVVEPVGCRLLVALWAIPG